MRSQSHGYGKHSSSRHNVIQRWAKRAVFYFTKGFVAHPGSYLRDPWNCLDFLIVCLAIVNFVPGVSNISVIRALRLLRPLRTINTLPGVKAVLNGLWGSLVDIIQAYFIITFIIVLFAGVGVQIWPGVLRQRCFDPVLELPANDTTYVL